MDECRSAKRMNAKTSLKHRGNPLANPSEQLVVLTPDQNGTRFESKLAASGIDTLKADRVEILQVNLGK